MKSLFAVTLSLGLLGAASGGALADCPGHAPVSADAGTSAPIVTADSSHSTGTAAPVATDRKG